MPNTPGAPRQGRDGLVRHPRDDRGAARPGGGAARGARPPARGRRREDGRDGDRGERDRADVRLPRHGGAHRRGRPPGLPAPRRPRPRHRDARRLDALREAVRHAPGRAAQHGHEPRRHIGRGAARARERPPADRDVGGRLGGVPADRRARRPARIQPRRARQGAARARDDGAHDHGRRSTFAGRPWRTPAPSTCVAPSATCGRTRPPSGIASSRPGPASTTLPGTSPVRRRRTRAGPTGRSPSTSATSPTGRSSPPTTSRWRSGRAAGRRTTTTTAATSTATTNVAGRPGRRCRPRPSSRA